MVKLLFMFRPVMHFMGSESKILIGDMTLVQIITREYY